MAARKVVQVVDEGLHPRQRQRLGTAAQQIGRAQTGQFHLFGKIRIIIGKAADMHRRHPRQTAQDVVRRKPSEIDHLNGYVVCKGVALGIPTPVNRLLHAQVRLLESAYAN